MVKKNTCIFISGQGSNLKNLIAHSRDYSFPIKISLVISNNEKANGISYAKKYNIPFIFIDTKQRNHENKIFFNLKKYKITFICLAGYMKIVSFNLINKYQKKIINIHPSLLPKYKGLNTHQRAIDNNEKYSGCTVHYVSSKLDSGKIILQKKVKLSKKETPLSLQKKILKYEHILYPRAINKLFANL